MYPEHLIDPRHHRVSTRGHPRDRVRIQGSASSSIVMGSRVRFRAEVIILAREVADLEGRAWAVVQGMRQDNMQQDRVPQQVMEEPLPRDCWDQDQCRCHLPRHTR